MQIAPKSAAPHSALAFLQLSAGQNAEALENHKKALGQQPDNPMILKKGNAQEARQRLEAAISKAQEQEPQKLLKTLQ